MPRRSTHWPSGKTRNARAGKPSRHTHEAQRQLDRDILPRLGRLRAEAISRQHVMQIVEAIADRGSYVAADRALGLIRTIYNWACGTGRLDRNPTLGLKKQNAGRARTRVLSPTELRAFWSATETVDGITPTLRDACQLQLLTGARISEVLEAPRAELDLDRGLWTIAAVRTKAAMAEPARGLGIWSTRRRSQRCRARSRRQRSRMLRLRLSNFSASACARRWARIRALKGRDRRVD